MFWLKQLIKAYGYANCIIVNIILITVVIIITIHWTGARLLNIPDYQTIPILT
jgi:hypothetical protein